MKVLTIAQGKGGVGKTTLTVNLACAALQEGFATLIIELDRQGTATGWYENRKREPKVIPSSGVELRKTLKAAEENEYDLVIIDLPGTHSPSAVWAIREADFVLMPGRPNQVDLEAAQDTVRAVVDEEKQGAFILTFAAMSSKEVKESKRQLEDLGLQVAPVSIRMHKNYNESVNEGFGVIEKYQGTPVEQEILSLWKWVKGKLSLELKNERSEKSSSSGKGKPKKARSN